MSIKKANFIQFKTTEQLNFILMNQIHDIAHDYNVENEKFYKDRVGKSSGLIGEFFSKNQLLFQNAGAAPKDTKETRFVHGFVGIITKSIVEKYNMFPNNPTEAQKSDPDYQLGYDEYNLLIKSDWTTIDSNLYDYFMNYATLNNVGQPGYAQHLQILEKVRQSRKKYVINNAMAGNVKDKTGPQASSVAFGAGESNTYVFCPESSMMDAAPGQCTSLKSSISHGAEVGNINYAISGPDGNIIYHVTGIFDNPQDWSNSTFTLTISFKYVSQPGVFDNLPNYLGQPTEHKIVLSPFSVYAFGEGKAKPKFQADSAFQDFVKNLSDHYDKCNIKYQQELKGDLPFQTFLEIDQLQNLLFAMQKEQGDALQEAQAYLKFGGYQKADNGELEIFTTDPSVFPIQLDGNTPRTIIGNDQPSCVRAAYILLNAIEKNMSATVAFNSGKGSDKNFIFNAAGLVVAAKNWISSNVVQSVKPVTATGGGKEKSKIINSELTKIIHLIIEKQCDKHNISKKNCIKINSIIEIPVRKIEKVIKLNKKKLYFAPKNYIQNSNNIIKRFMQNLKATLQNTIRNSDKNLKNQILSFLIIISKFQQQLNNELQENQNSYLVFKKFGNININSVKNRVAITKKIFTEDAKSDDFLHTFYLNILCNDLLPRTAI